MAESNKKRLGNERITVEDAVRIKLDNRPCTKIAESYPIKAPAVRHIRNGVTWSKKIQTT